MAVCQFLSYIGSRVLRQTYLANQNEPVASLTFSCAPEPARIS